MFSNYVGLEIEPKENMDLIKKEEEKIADILNDKYIFDFNEICDDWKEKYDLKSNADKINLIENDDYIIIQNKQFFAIKGLQKIINTLDIQGSTNDTVCFYIVDYINKRLLC